MLYKGREKVVTLYEDYSSIASEAKYKSTHVEALEVLNPKKTRQILLIARAQVKAGNTSENILNKSDVKILEQLKSGFKRTTNWNKYQ